MHKRNNQFPGAAKLNHTFILSYRLIFYIWSPTCAKLDKGVNYLQQPAPFSQIKILSR